MVVIFRLTLDNVQYCHDNLDPSCGLSTLEAARKWTGHLAKTGMLALGGTWQPIEIVLKAEYITFKTVS